MSKYDQIPLKDGPTVSEGAILFVTDLSFRGITVVPTADGGHELVPAKHPSVGTKEKAAQMTYGPDIRKIAVYLAAKETA